MNNPSPSIKIVVQQHFNGLIDSTPCAPRRKDIIVEDDLLVIVLLVFVLRGVLIVHVKIANSRSLQSRMKLK